MKDNLPTYKIISSPKLIISLYAVLFTLVTGFTAFFYFENNKNGTITVTGNSQTQVSNNVSSYSLNLEVTNSDKTAAVKDISDQASSIVSQLKDFGIPTQDIKTTNLNVYQKQMPIYDGSIVRDYEKGDWVANYTVEVTLRDLSKSGDLTVLLTGFKTATMWGPSVSVDDSAIDETSLLNSAYLDAKQKAQVMAASMGKRLGKAVQISEGSLNSGYNMPMYEKAVGMGGGGSAVPVEPGSTQASKSVVVTFELK